MNRLEGAPAVMEDKDAIYSQLDAAYQVVRYRKESEAGRAAVDEIVEKYNADDGIALGEWVRTLADEAKDLEGTEKMKYAGAVSMLQAIIGNDAYETVLERAGVSDKELLDLVASGQREHQGRA